MPNRRLTHEELLVANSILKDLDELIAELAAGDAELQFAYRRKIWKGMMHRERSKPAQRRKLKTLLYQHQEGRCAQCKKEIPKQYSVLDRTVASNGYVVGNVNLICWACDRAIQASRRFSDV